MSSPTHELVGTATARLRNFGALVSLIGANKVFYRPPPTLVPPYVVIDDATLIRDDAECVSGSIVTLNVHVWTDDSHPLLNGGGALQDARAIGYEVTNALHQYPLALPTKRLVTLEQRNERVFYDADGTTGHGVFEFAAIIEA